MSDCVIFVMKNLTQTDRSHRCALFRPRTFIIGDNCKGRHYLMLHIQVKLTKISYIGTLFNLIYTGFWFIHRSVQTHFTVHYIDWSITSCDVTPENKIKSE